MFRFQCTINNYSFLPIMLATTLLDEQGVAQIIFSALGAELVVWTLGLQALTGKPASAGRGDGAPSSRAARWADGARRLAAGLRNLASMPLLAMAAAAGWAAWEEIPVPWDLFVFYTALLVALAWCFLGIAMFISTLARSADVAQGAAFLTWLVLLLFLDLILLGLMIQERLPPETIVGIALANPLQVFRTAAMLLFDPQLVLLGPAAYVILDAFGQNGYIAWAIGYPVLLGSLAALGGFLIFRRGDLP